MLSLSRSLSLSLSLSHSLSLSESLCAGWHGFGGEAAGAEAPERAADEALELDSISRLG